MRTLVDIPENDIQWLDCRAQEKGKSRAAMVREAVSAYRSEADAKRETDKSWIDAAFGLWKDRTDVGDGLEVQRRMRAEWVRPWDPEYPETRAEFHDLFDERDDREYEYHKEREARTRGGHAV